MKRFSWLLISVLLFMGACSEQRQSESTTSQLPYYEEATFTPRWLSKDDAYLKELHQISSFELINQEGDTITEKTFENKIYIADFFFTTCPGICPKMTKNMGLVQDAFKLDDDVLLLSHSVTPVRDSVAVLKKYAQNNGVIPEKWHLVTGRQTQIYKLGRNDYFIEEDLGLGKTADEFLHTENFVLIDKNRHIRGIYNGLNKLSIFQLISDVRTLKEEG